MERFPLMSRWILTDDGSEIDNHTQRSRAEVFGQQRRDMAKFHWTLITQYVAKPADTMHLKFECVDPQDGVRHETHLPLAQMQHYLQRGWVKRVDVEEMERMYPLNSAWKVTEDGFAHIAGPLKAAGPVTWVVLQLNITTGPPVGQSITLWNRLRNPTTVTVDIQQWRELQVKRYIERINIDVVLVDDNQFLIKPRDTNVQALVETGMLRVIP